MVKGYYSTAKYLIEALNIFATTTIKVNETDSDKMLMLASVIWEYLFPLLTADGPHFYLREGELLNLLMSFSNQSGLSKLLDTIELHFPADQLQQIVQPLMVSLCRHISRPSPTNGTEYARLLVALMEREQIMHAWLSSESLCSDLEQLYFLPMPTREEIAKVVSGGSGRIYHETLPGTEDMRITYREGIETIGLAINQRQVYLAEITEKLMDTKPRTEVDSGH
jgi:hypothetical protein